MVVGRSCAECGTKETPMWRNIKDVGFMCNKCGIKLTRWRKSCLKKKVVRDRLHNRVESKRYNLKSLTKEFGELLEALRPEDEGEFKRVLMKCCNRTMLWKYGKGESVEFSVLNIPLDVWRELRGLTE